MKKNLYLISKAMLTQPFSICLSGNFLNIIKRHLAKSGFKGYPVITLAGAPNKGKTSVYEACIPSEDCRFCAAEYDSRSIKKAIKENPDKHINLDDISMMNSEAGFQSMKNMADKFIRIGFQGNYIIAGLTVEEDALEKIRGSARERLLVLNVNKLWTEETMEMTEKLLLAREALQDIIQLFVVWFEEAAQSYDFKAMRAAFVKAYSDVANKNTRTLNKVFAYYVAVTLYFHFLKEIETDVYMDFSNSWEQKLESLIVPFLQNEATDSVTREQQLMRALENVLKRPDFRVQKPVCKTNCKEYLRGRCSECKKEKENYCISETYTDVQCNHTYDPVELIVDEDHHALFLRDGSKVVGWPRDQKKTGPHPVLVVSPDVLVPMLNDELAKIADAEGIAVLQFTENEVRDLLIKFNMLIYYYSSSRSRYKFTHLTYEMDSLISYQAFFIRLTKTQAMSLAETAKPYSSQWGFDSKGYTKMISTLATQWNRFRFPVGEIGTSNH